MAPPEPWPLSFCGKIEGEFAGACREIKGTHFIQFMYMSHTMAAVSYSSALERSLHVKDMENAQAHPGDETKCIVQTPPNKKPL